MYYVQNCLKPNVETGTTEISEYDGVNVKRCDQPFDTLTIKQTDRKNVGYRDGVAAPYYPENQ